MVDMEMVVRIKKLPMAAAGGSRQWKSDLILARRKADAKQAGGVAAQVCYAA